MPKRIIFSCTNDVTEAIDWIEEGKGIAEIPFAVIKQCAANIEKRTESLRFLGEPEQYIEVLNELSLPKNPSYSALNANPP